ncbi:MAG TPA: tetratricopeptide repeat protein [Saprospiraceae bacterium]|jgi:tetratricopeptide (TPR) repeat protein|nr:hypothetical protein [Saprospiraceae bacterium]HRO08719.1 tetratricopeptide repeat protein [Saprospiraceae bacterium]HRP42030.1 tetratricopeptide repeat protein [Saprospiraceae bacterium]
MRLPIIVMISLIVVGCKNSIENIDLKEDIPRLEAAYKKEKSDSLLTKLIYAYGEKVSITENKTEKIKLLKNAINMVKVPGYDEYRVVFLAELIKIDPQGNAKELLDLGKYYEDEENLNAASILYSGFKQRYPNDPRIKDINHKIFIDLSDSKLYFKNLLKDVFDEKANRGVDTEKGRAFINEVNAFALGYAGNTSVPNLLMISADVARAIGDPNTSVGQYDWVYNYYPDYSKASLALFLKGYEIDNSLKRYDDARKVYDTFLKVYPNDSLAKDVKYLIKNLGKTTDESFREMLPVEQ